MIEISAMFPVFVAEKLPDLQTYYQAHFGFETVFYEPGFYLHLLNPGSGVQLGFLVPDHASQPPFLRALATHEGMVVSFEVSDARAAFTSAQQENLDIAMDYKEEAWGQRHFIVRDPQGLLIDIVEHTQQDNADKMTESS